MFSFIKKQILDIKKGGVSILLNKIDLSMKIILKFLLYLILSPIFLLVILFVRIVRPIILVRWMELTSTRIGHFAIEPALYLCAQQISELNKKKKIYDIFYLDKSVSNAQLCKMWSRKIRIWPSWIMEPLVLINNYFTGSKKHDIKNYLPSERSRDTSNVLEKFSPQLKFTSIEEEYGYEKLKSMGISKKDRFVCLIVRDSVYLKNQFPKLGDLYFSYHNYRDANIENYYLVSEYLSKLNYFVLRMGAKVEKKMDKINDRVIDYASSNIRSDFMDIFLSAKCSFVIGTPTGLDQVANIFRKDCVKTNMVPIALTGTYVSQNLYIYKHLIDKKTEKKLTLSQIINKGLETSQHSSIYREKEVDVKENSPEEILAVTKEKIDRLNNDWEDTIENQQLQDKFWSVFPIQTKGQYGTPLHNTVKCRVGTEFLKNNKNLLC